MKILTLVRVLQVRYEFLPGYHADPAITLRVYAHVIRAAETAAADIFAQAVKAA